MVRTASRESSSGRLFPPDFATVDRHRECYTYTDLRGTFGRNWVSREGEPVNEFLHVREDLFLHDEVWLQPYLYVSLQSRRSVGNTPDVDEDAEPAQEFDTEPAIEPEDLEPLPWNEALAENSHQPEVHLDDAGNEVPDISSDTDDLPDIDMDRPL